MENLYYVYSTKLTAWWGNNSIYTSDIKQARTFTHEEAIKFCKTRYSPADDSLSAVPVSVHDIELVMGK